MSSLLKYILTTVIILNLGYNSYSQTTQEKGQLDIRFLKDKVDIVPGKSFFNLLLIENKTDAEITFNVQYNTPKDWEVIGASSEQITLQPLTNISLPVRVAVSKNAKGGIGYAVVAVITDLKGMILESEYTFLNIPVKSKIKVSSSKSSYYLDHRNRTSSFSISADNQGNTEENINIELIMDKSLSVIGFTEEIPVVNERIESGKKKNFSFDIKLKKEIDLDKYKLHKIKAIIKSNDSVINKTIWFKYIDWRYNNFEYNPNTPLNIEFNAYNILSDARANYRVKVYGRVLFKNNKDVFYSFENINRDNTNNLWINSRLQLEINSKRTSIFLGDYQGSIGQSMYGRGVSITQFLGKKDFINLIATQRLITKTNNFGGIYSHTFRVPLSIELGGAYSNNLMYEKLNYLGQVKLSTNILSKHRLNLTYGNSNSILQTYTYTGWSYRMDYSSSFKKVNLKVNSFYASPAYSGVNNGRFYTQAQLSYNTENNKQIIISNILRRYRPGYFVDNVLYDDKFSNSNKSFLRLNTSLSSKIHLFTGPIFIQQSTNNFYSLAPNSQFSTYTGKYEFGLKLFDSFSNNSVSFSAKYGMTNVYNYSSELNGSPFTGNIDNRFYPVIELSTNIKKNDFNIYVMYFHGPYNITQQFAYFYSFFYSKSLNVIPSYEKFIYKKAIKFILRGSYISNLTAKSNRVNVNSGLYWYANKGWKLRFVNTTSYQKVNDGSNFNFANTSTFFEFGISKSFNLQQPRLKFYDYEAVYYKDLNGNRIHDANEPGVPTVLSDIQRQDPIADKANPNYNGDFLANELLSNSSGTINYIYMPEGDYTLKYYPTSENLGTFDTETVEKQFTISSDTVIHIPFIERNKLFGKVNLNRTKHSALGEIPIDNIKVSVEGNEKTYSAITDKDGYFELFIPVSDYYKVKINNIFHEHFNLRQEYYIVKFNGYKQFELSFDFDEKERKIAFDESDFLITDDDVADADFSFEDIKVIKQTNLKGGVKDANSLIPLHATVSIHNINTNELISETASSKRTGVYFTSFFAGEDYNIKAETKGYWTYKANLNIQQVTTFENITHDILLKKIFIDEEIKTDNLGFSSEKAELSPLGMAELDNMLSTLFLNPDIHIEVSGHTDNIEALLVNPIQLSKARASTVASYLVSHGLKESRIKIKSMGNSSPKSTDDSDEGRTRNRRVEIRVAAF